MVKHITASEIGDFWASLIRKKSDYNEDRDNGLETGKKIHDLILRPLERISGNPIPTCDGYRFLFNKGLEKAGADGYDKEILRELKRKLGDEDILKRIGVNSSGDITKIRVEHSLRVDPNIMYARVDILRVDPVIVYNLKTGNYPETGGFLKDCVQLAAESFAAWGQLGKIDGAFLVYIRATGNSGKPRAINPMDYFDQVMTCVGGILGERGYGQKDTEPYINFLKKVKDNFRISY